MGIFDVFTRKKPVPSDQDRRDALLKHGRITEGTIIDSDTDADGSETVYYYYSVHGSDYESSQVLSPAQRENILAYSPGAKVSVRYDQKNHGNSVIV